MHKSGDIIFVYKDIPINVTTIGDEAHPVKVGVSDAYIIDRTIFCELIDLYFLSLFFIDVCLFVYVPPFFSLIQSSAGRRFTNTTRSTRRRTVLPAAQPSISRPCRPVSASTRATRASQIPSTLNAPGVLRRNGARMARIGTDRIGSSRAAISSKSIGTATAAFRCLRLRLRSLRSRIVRSPAQHFLPSTQPIQSNLK